MGFFSQLLWFDEWLNMYWLDKNIWKLAKRKIDIYILSFVWYLSSFWFCNSFSPFLLLKPKLALMLFFYFFFIFCMICCAWTNTGKNWTEMMTSANAWIVAAENGKKGWKTCTCILLHRDGCIDHFITSREYHRIFNFLYIQSYK